MGVEVGKSFKANKVGRVNKVFKVIRVFKVFKVGGDIGVGIFLVPFFCFLF